MANLAGILPRSPGAMPIFNQRPAFFRYLAAVPSDRHWGLAVTTAGHSRTHPESSGYPPEKHPSAYHFEWKKGRILDEFQIVHIVRGGGFFESATHGKAKIRAGEALLLFPGEWHRYKPDPGTGWDECWIGFDGLVPRQLAKNKTFRPSSPVFAPEDGGSALRELYFRAIEVLEREPPAHTQLLSGLAYQMLAQLHSVARGSGRKAAANDLAMRRLKAGIESRLAEKIDWNELARGLGMGYSSMRHLFRRHAGISPHQYQIQLRLNKARLLLNTTGDSLKSIAQKVGFECPYHFAHLFKRKTGRSPGDWRRAARGGDWVEQSRQGKNRPAGGKGR